MEQRCQSCSVRCTSLQEQTRRFLRSYKFRKRKQHGFAMLWEFLDLWPYFTYFLWSNIVQNMKTIWEILGSVEVIDMKAGIWEPLSLRDYKMQFSPLTTLPSSWTTPNISGVIWAFCSMVVAQNTYRTQKIPGSAPVYLGIFCISFELCAFVILRKRRIKQKIRSSAPAPVHKLITSRRGMPECASMDAKTLVYW